MQFKVTIDVDIATIKQLYRDNNNLDISEEIPDIKEIILEKMEWVTSSGITPKKIETI